MTDSASDVCLFPYRQDDMGPFLQELKRTTGVRFRESPLRIGDVCSFSTLHTLSPFDPWDVDALEASRIEGRPCIVQLDDGEFALKTDVYAALEWGQAHARRC